jgi:hypothetical protein
MTASTPPQHRIPPIWHWGRYLPRNRWLRTLTLLTVLAILAAAGWQAYETGRYLFSRGESAARSVVNRAERAVGRVQGWMAPVNPMRRDTTATEIAPLFTPEVIYWEDDILRWSQTYDLEPNLLATVMQIESCGHPTVNSPAGAQGLFQVMPMHFTEGEQMLDPDTNAMRGAGVLNECIAFAEGDIGLAMACYNGGPSVIWADSSRWYAEVKAYYYWGVAIYADALVDKTESATLTEWLNAGGSRLCNSASAAIATR